MKKIKTIFCLVLLLSFHVGDSCSMYKVTKNGKTMVGCNEDAWRTTSHIWFEVGQNNQYGAAFTGSRWDGENGYAPQSGMNEHGLVFSRLASYHPKLITSKFNNRIQITNPTRYLKDILHSCKTVEDVKKYIEKYDQRYFIEDVFIYIERSGKYIIVEPYKILSGNDAKYVLSNFCPSITHKSAANKLERYKKGTSFLTSKIETDLDFCRKLSDTMHVCREKIGDGTLLTSIWDSTNGVVNLYFYHQYDQTVQFNLTKELAKGNHILKIDTLFPKNAEFEKLASYQTPQNNDTIRAFLMISGLFFALCSVYFLIHFIANRKKDKFNVLKILVVPFGLLLFYYMLVLCTNIAIFYFPAPYTSPTSIFVSGTSYIPYILVLLILPSLWANYRLMHEKLWSRFALVMISMLNVLVLLLIGFFVYWHFYFN
ncbi:MAG: hypothetical protein KA513_05175 [Flavobacterium sp.]|nr:hypothetical protein [Flavobacterium sp.]